MIRNLLSLPRLAVTARATAAVVAAAVVVVAVQWLFIARRACQQSRAINLLTTHSNTNTHIQTQLQ